MFAEELRLASEEFYLPPLSNREDGEGDRPDLGHDGGHSAGAPLSGPTEVQGVTQKEGNGMNCPKVRLLMEDYLKGELRKRVSLRVAKHLKRCPACAAYEAEESTVVSLLKSAFRRCSDSGVNPDDMWHKVMEGIHPVK